MNSDSAHVERKQFTPKTIDVKPEQGTWVGGRSRKSRRLGKSQMLFAEILDHGFRICRKFVKETLTPPRKHADKYGKWPENGVMLIVKA
tara:strand:- start:1673 stop:1939 length:267 start_codon:yes stop_codon:yes gene_type:complete